MESESKISESVSENVSSKKWTSEEFFEHIEKTSEKQEIIFDLNRKNIDRFPILKCTTEDGEVLQIDLPHLLLQSKNFLKTKYLER